MRDRGKMVGAGGFASGGKFHAAVELDCVGRQKSDGASRTLNRRPLGRRVLRLGSPTTIAGSASTVVESG
jgi:hypothetical protein